MRRNILVKEKTGLENVSDIELIEKMSFGELDRKTSHEGFAEFHRRYAEWVYSSCYYVCRLMRDPESAASDLTEIILIRAFTYASSYNPNRASIKTWLNKISQNEFNDYYAEYRKNHPIENTDEEESELTILVDSDETIDRTKINGPNLELALENLTEMEQDIVLTHMRYKDIDNLDSQIPPAAMKELCEIYKKKPFTIRKIKSRALSKIKTFILKL